MAYQDLALPTDIPWKRLAASSDMIDVTHDDRQFPPKWRSSVAIFYHEPEDVPTTYCDRKITYLKAVYSITGYQVGNEFGTEQSSANASWRQEEKKLADKYHPCYGALLQMAVYPGSTVKKRRERRSLNFGQLQPPTRTLPNPYQNGSLTFQAAGQASNRTVDRYPQLGDQRGELDLFKEMMVTFPATSRVEAQVAHSANPANPVTMEAYRGNELVGSQTAGRQAWQIHQLAVEGEAIDRVVFRTPEGNASLLEFAFFEDIEESLALNDYPYIVDFEPKRRELYEAVTKSGEVLGRSTSTLNVRKGTTSTDTTEQASKVGAEVSVAVPVPPAVVGGKVTAEHAWKNGTALEESNVKTTDDSREKRETYSHSTSLTQMYELFTGYHLGSNRAVFSMVPRPHTVEEKDKYTFVNGPRRMEGVQEIFLVVNRPKDMPGLCVEALLETAHLEADAAGSRDNVTPGEPPTEFEEKTRVVSFSDVWPDGGGDHRARKSFSKVLFDLPEGCVLDTSKGGGSYVNHDVDDPNETWTVTIPDGFDISYRPYPSTIERSIGGLSASVTANKVEFTVELRGMGGHGWWGRGPERFSADITIHYKCPKQPETPAPDENATKDETMFLTSRALSACVVPNGNEKSLPGSVSIPVDWEAVMSADAKDELLDWLDQHRIIELPGSPEDYRQQLENLYDTNRSGFEQKLKDALKRSPIPIPDRWLLPTEWISFETTVPVPEKIDDPKTPAEQRVRSTNELGARIGDTMVASLRSSERYPDRALPDFTMTKVGLERLSRAFGEMPATHPENRPVSELVVPHKEDLRRAFGDIRRRDLLLLELPELQRIAGVSEIGARHIKAALVRGEQADNGPAPD